MSVFVTSFHATLPSLLLTIISTWFQNHTIRLKMYLNWLVSLECIIVDFPSKLVCLSLLCPTLLKP